MQEGCGLYPYADGGGLVTAAFVTEDWAMENQTRPTYPPFHDPGRAHRLLTHEVAHQWFGTLGPAALLARRRGQRGVRPLGGNARDRMRGGPSADAQLETLWAEHPADDSF